LVAPKLADLLALDDSAFRKVFAGSPIKRIGRGRMVRNAAIAAGNSGSVELAPVLERLTADEDPVVAEAAAWGLRKLASPSPDGEGDHPKGGGGVIGAEFGSSGANR
jgi:epoxyqueuosine reductase